jgi:AAA family ATPase
MKCKDLYLSLVPPNVGSSNGIESESDHHPERSTMVMETPKKGPSTPLHKKESHHFPSNSGCSMCLDPTTAISALADEKVNDLLQTSAVRWLNGRHLLKGNFVPLSVCGKLSLFVVMGAEPDSSSHDVLCEKGNTLSNAEDSTKSTETPVLFLVDGTTKVHLSDSVCTKQLDLDKLGLPSELSEYGDKRNEDSNNVPTLGGLSKESATIKGIISFSLADQIGLPRYCLNRYTLLTIFTHKN